MTKETVNPASDEDNHVNSLIGDYARSWSLLHGYDEQGLVSQSHKQQNMRSINLQQALQAIQKLKTSLIDKGEAGELFGKIRGNGFESALATIEQGFGDDLFYPNIATRAAHLLYFIIKNHPFADGNKRSGSFVFLWYLNINQHLLAKPVELLINDNTLVALALLIAQSLPEQKEITIKLAENFILLKNENLFTN